MKIKILSIAIENFKGIKNLLVDFSKDNTIIFGQNASGKTSIVDAFMWLLFNKDSRGVSKFNVRPLDSNNKQIDNVEIKVIATLDIYGRKVKLQKVQKQKWTKKRGSDVKEFTGNINEYEVDEFPKKEKDFKEYVASIVNEELFALVTNPMAFTSLDWKKQREIILNLVTDVTDEDVINSNKDLFGSIAEQLVEHSVDDLTAKEKKALSTYKKELSELPARIDELNNSKSDVNVAELEKQKVAINNQISEIEKQSSSFEEQYKQYDELQTKIMKSKFDLSGIANKINESTEDKKREINKKLTSLINEVRDEKENANDLQRTINSSKERIDRYTKFKKDLLEDYKQENEKQFDESKWVFDDSSTVCSMCGQILPEDKIRTLKNDFESKKESTKSMFGKVKQSRINEIVKQGKEFKESIESLEKSISEHRKEIENAKVKVAKLEIQINDTNKELLAVVPEDVSKNTEYIAKQKEISDMESKLESMETGADLKQQLDIQRRGLNEQLIEVEKMIASADNSKINDRIAELEENQKLVGQKISDCESVLYTLEQFTKAKMEMLSCKINEKFKTVNFKLFSEQVNGGYAETCECTVNGVPYSDLNNGHRIIAGLDIINSLSELYEVKAPIFIDNAECLNDFNVPEIDTQLILLKVSDDKQLVVESEE